MKITFKAKIVYEDTSGDIVTYEQINLDKAHLRIEEVLLPWDNSAEPTIVIKKRT